MKMNNRTVKTTVNNIVKGMWATRETAIHVAQHEYREGKVEQSKATVKRYNKQFSEASNVISTLCILSAEKYTENMQEFLNKVQNELCDMVIGFSDDIAYEVDTENWGD